MSDIESAARGTSEGEERHADNNIDIHSSHKKTRREAIQTLTREFLGLTVGGSLAYSIIVPPKMSNTVLDDNATDPQPVGSQRNIDDRQLNDWYLTPHEFERDIEGIRHKFFGVAHTREFAEAHYDRMEELVKNSKYVISEAEPPYLTRKSITNNGKAYFGTIFELCKKYHKPILFNDSSTRSLRTFETAVGITAFLSLYSNIRTPTHSRRDFLKSLVKACGSTYIFLGTSTGLNTRNYISGEDAFEGKNNARYFNHLIDQRNVYITHRTIIMAKTVLKTFSEGDYVLSTYGKVHTKGVEYYLDHPKMYEAKKNIYAMTINTFTKEQLKLYRWNGLTWNGLDLSKRINFIQKSASGR